MSESTLARQGRTTVPRQVRERLGAGPGTRRVRHVMPGGAVIVRARTRSVLELAGSLDAPGGRQVTVEDMNPWR